MDKSTKPQVVTRADVEAALARVEKGEALPDDATMLRAIVRAYFAIVDDDADGPILEPD